MIPCLVVLLYRNYSEFKGLCYCSGILKLAKNMSMNSKTFVFFFLYKVCKMTKAKSLNVKCLRALSDALKTGGITEVVQLDLKAAAVLLCTAAETSWSPKPTNIRLQHSLFLFLACYYLLS